MLGGLFDLRPDPDAGVLNVALPILWALGAVIGIVADGVELVSNPNWTTRRAVAHLVATLRGADGHRTVRLSSNTFHRLHQVYERTIEALAP